MGKIKKTYFQENQILNLSLLTLNKSNESKILILNDKELIKLFHFISDNKLLTLQLIEDKMDELNLIKEFILFSKYAFVGNNFRGIILNKGFEMTLRSFANNPNTSYNDKIIVLKQIGMVLEQLKYFREKENILTDFFIGDIQENNILVDPATLKIQFVDLDSCKIGNNRAFITKYLQFLRTYSYVKNNLSTKYFIVGDNFDINENTDLYCYIVVIMKVLFNIDISVISADSYNKIIEALYSYGLPEPLYEAFIKLYKNEDNINPYKYLDDIPKDFERSIIL